MGQREERGGGGEGIAEKVEIGKMGRGDKKRENERRMRIYQSRGEID